MAKLLVIAILVVILISLGSGLFYMLKDRGKSDRTLKALSWRIGLSVTLFLLLMLMYAAGFIKPHGIVPQPGPSQPKTTQ